MGILSIPKPDDSAFLGFHASSMIFYCKRILMSSAGALLKPKSRFFTRHLWDQVEHVFLIAYIHKAVRNLSDDDALGDGNGGLDIHDL